jgi:molybdenum cofactor cytidylyltransferase
MRPIVGLLLAAGSGRRFGGDKLRAVLPDGRRVGEAAALALRVGVDRAIAIVRPDAAPLAALLQTAGLETLVNPTAADGMAGSIRCGVAASADAAGWLIALADMPWIAPATFAAVTGAVRNGSSIAAPFHRGRRGHPVGFQCRWAPELMALTGERGARELLARQADEIVAIQVDDPAILMDVDRPADLAAGPRRAHRGRRNAQRVD